MTTPADILAAEQALAIADPMLGRLIASQPSQVRLARTDYFASLCRSIVGQQVSVAAASTIFARFEVATELSPQRISAASIEDLRAVGLSRQKARYLKDLAEHFVANPAVFDHLDTLPNDSVISELTAIKGIGEWTAQMFLMFTLLRLDVFAPDDVGLQRAMKQLYGWDALPTRANLIDAARKWQPYRTVACWHLWHSLDNSPAGN